MINKYDRVQCKCCGEYALVSLDQVQDLQELSERFMCSLCQEVLSKEVEVKRVPSSRKFKVYVEEVKRLQERRREINEKDLRDLEFYEGGKRVEISQELVELWNVTGLSNVDFIDSGYYLTTEDKGELDV